MSIQRGMKFKVPANASSLSRRQTTSASSSPCLDSVDGAGEPYFVTDGAGGAGFLSALWKGKALFHNQQWWIEKPYRCKRASSVKSESTYGYLQDRRQKGGKSVIPHAGCAA